MTMTDYHNRHRESQRIDAAQREVMRQAAWDMYVAAALGMSMHPGTTRDAAKPMTHEQICEVADSLLFQRDRRFGRV